MTAKQNSVSLELDNRSKKITTSCIDVNNIQISKSQCVKYLGAYLDESLTMKHHITEKCKTASINLTRIKNIRKYLTQEACSTVMLGLLIVHLDFGNALFAGLPKVDIQRLQWVRNTAATIVLGRTIYDSATQCLKTLCWLPIRLRIEYKILVIHKQAPGYLVNLLQQTTPNRTTRAGQDTNRLAVPRMQRKTLAARSFTVMGPIAWNRLPGDLTVDSLNSCKKRLKTYLISKF